MSSWRLAGISVLEDWQPRAPVDAVAPMRHFIKALARGPLQVASSAYQRPDMGQVLAVALVPNTDFVLAWLVDDERHVVTLVGIVLCVDGLIFQAAKRIP